MTRYIDPPRKLLYHVDRLAALKRGEQPPPLNVEIDLSNRCSLGCEWCHFAYTHTRGPLAGKQEKPTGAVAGGDLMIYAMALDVIDQLHEAGVESVTWSGGGEPTLHPQFDQIVAYAWGKLAQGLYTHGGHVDADRAALLKQLFSWVYVSLDECTRDTYQDSKGADRFSAALGGIKHLVQADGPATVGVGFLLHAGNAWRVHEMVELGLDRLGANYVQFRPTVRYNTATPSVRAERAGWVTEAIERLDEYEDNERVVNDVSRFEMYRDWTGHGYDICHWVQMQTVITPNGKMWLCCNTREQPGAELGDLSRETFADIWARSKAVDVGPACRVMCRGHIANLALTDILDKRPKHWEFV